MAHKIEILRGATTYVLNDPSDPSNPFSLEDGAGLGGASVRNIEERGPYQDGATHLTSRLEPGVMTLRIFVKGATAAALDGHRDTLNKMFKPIEGIPITVKITRDDGAIRYQENQRTGPLDIPFVKEHRPGNLHKAVVQLRAADPTWYDPDEQEETFLAPQSEWWLAFSTIGSANTLEHVESPSQGQLWAHSGSVAVGSAWSIAFRSGSVTPPGGGSILYAFDQSNSSFLPIQFAASLNVAGGYGAGVNAEIQGALMSSGTANYFLIHNGGTTLAYRDSTLLGTGTLQAPILGTAAGTARWRSDYANNADTRWPQAIPRAAIYKIDLSPTQRGALHQALATSGSLYSVVLAYTGDYDSYPVITINGPITSPIITNTATGDVLDFTSGTVGSADVWTIDTRYGRKSVLNIAGSSVANYLSDDSDLATFRIVPDPLAAGGTNTITVSSGSAGTAASIALAYNKRFLSY